MLLENGCGARISLPNFSPMEEFAANMHDSISNAVRKKRSRTSRRPRPDSQQFSDICDISSISTTPPSDDPSKVSGDENIRNEYNSNRKELNVNQCVSKISPARGAEYEKTSRKIEEDGEFYSFQNCEPQTGYNKRSSEGIVAPVNQKNGNLINGESQIPGLLGVNLDGTGNESKVKKVKLKVGGVTHTIRANSSSDGGAGADPCTKGSRFSDVSRQRQKQKPEGNLENYNSPSDKNGLKGIPWKDFSREDLIIGKGDSLTRKMAGKNRSGKQGEQSEPVRKSKRVHKRRLLDEEFGEAGDDEEIRYLEKLKNSKFAAGRKEDEEESGKKRKLSRITGLDNAGATGSGKDGKKRSRCDRQSEDTDYKEDEEPLSDGEFEDTKKKQGKESVDSSINMRREASLTTRQRALQSSRDGTSVPDSSVIEFPNGLPPAPPKKQKEKLSELELQSKKAEAAQRRRMQIEKAARESEAEAIRKILGQDSSRKKREEQKKKRLEELAKEKATNAAISQSKCVRTVMSPSGTVVTFPEDMGLPSIFDSKPSSYPPPRENCAGPSCANPYKYRDSKTNLPLCSLKCYKAIREKTRVETAG